MEQSDRVIQKGKVLSLKGENAVVRFVRTDACGHCNACFHLGSNEADIEIVNLLNAKPGDVVSIQMHSTSIMKATVISYGLPLLLFLAGILFGSQYGEKMAVLLGLLACGVSFLILRALEPKISRMNSFKPRMLEILNETPVEEMQPRHK